MQSIVRYFLVIACVVALVGGVATAQDLQQQLAKLGHDAAVGYVTPLLSGIGNDLNSGIYYSADLHGVLGFDIGVKVSASHFTDADKTYLLTLPATIVVQASDLSSTYPAGYTVTLTSGANYLSQVKANTAVGSKDAVDIKTTGGFGTLKNSSGTPVGTPVPVPPNKIFMTLPGGFDIGAIGVPLVMPQLALGLPFGLEVMIRYVPTISAGDAGKFNYMGFGLRYNIDQWIPVCPVDIAVHFMTQTLTFNSKADQDIFSGKATAYGAEVSKKFFILTLFGGFQLENSTLTLNDYEYNDPSGQSILVPGFEVKGANKSRFTVGARLLLLFINVHAEYSLAKNNMLSAGVEISIR